MDSLFFHPKLVHLPIALGVLMPLVACGLVLAWWRTWLPWRSWIIAVALQAVLLASGIAALRSGEAAEERVERFVSEQFIEAHEEAAEVFVIASGAVLGMMLLAAALGSRRGLPVAALATVGTIVVLGFGYRTGQGGGSLVYEHGAAQAYTTAAAATSSVTENARRERDDDD